MKQNETDSSVQRQIDENLRRVYGEVQKQDVPDRFAKLLQQLKDGNPDSGSSADGS